jgi:hypothetical protein
MLLTRQVLKLCDARVQLVVRIINYRRLLEH